MKKLVCSLFLVAVATPAFAVKEARTATATAVPAAAPAETAPEPGALELKHKSSFAVDGSSRNPFWPIGWKPVVKQTTAANGAGEQAGPEIQASAFVVSSITVDATGRYAIINGKPMKEGQVFGLQMGNQTFQITVKTIQDGQIILLRRDQEIAVPLRRR